MKFMDYEIKFGIEATTKSGILKKLKEIQKSNDDGVEAIEMMLNMVQEFLLVGLQKRYKEEFGYDYNTGEGKAEALSKVCDLIDDYTDKEDSSINDLFNELVDEVMKNGFFKKQAQEMEAEKKVKTENQKTK